MSNQQQTSQSKPSFAISVLYNEGDLAAYVVDSNQPTKMYLPDGREWTALRDTSQDETFVCHSEWMLALASASYLQSFLMLRQFQRESIAVMTEPINDYLTRLRDEAESIAASSNGDLAQKELARAASLNYQAALAEAMRVRSR